MKSVTIGEMLHKLASSANKQISYKDRDFISESYITSQGGFNTSVLSSDDVDRIDELYSEHCK